MRKAFRPGYKTNQPSIRPTRKASSPCSKPNQLLRLTASALIRVRAWPGGGRRMDTRESAPAVRNHGPTGDDTMQMATTLRRSTHTFLTHLFGPGLDDDRYVIERFQSKADGEILPRHAQWGVEEGPGQGFPRDRLPEHRPADEARARRDHHLHRRQPHHPRRSILGGSSGGLVRRREVSLTRGRRGRPAGFRRPDVLRRDYNRGGEEHALQGSRKRTYMRAAAL